MSSSTEPNGLLAEQEIRPSRELDYSLPSSVPSRAREGKYQAAMKEWDYQTWAERYGSDTLGMPIESGDVLTAGHVPQLDRTVHRPRGQCLAVWAEHQGGDLLVCPLIVVVFSPVATSHSSIVPSQVPEGQRVLPSGLNATEQTSSVRPLMYSAISVPGPTTEPLPPVPPKPTTAFDSWITSLSIVDATACRKELQPPPVGQMRSVG